MSAEIATFESIDNLGGNAEPMSLTAFVGGKNGSAIQFTIRDRYCALSENQLIQLKTIINGRLNGLFSATGSDPDIRLHP